MPKSYRSRLLIISAVILLLAETFVLTVGFLTAQAYFVNNRLDVSVQQLYTVHAKTLQAYDAVEQFASSIAQDGDILAAMDSVDGNPSVASERMDAVQRLLTAVNIRKNANSIVSKVYLKTKRYLLDDIRLLNDSGPDGKEIKNPYFLRRISERQLEEFILKRHPDARAEHIFFQSIGEERGVACLINMKALYKADDISCLYILNQNGLLLYGSGPDVDIYAMRAELEKSDEPVFRTINGKVYLAVGYRPASTAYFYVLLHPLSPIVAPLWESFYKLISLSVLLLMLCIPLFRWLSGIVMDPVHALIREINGYENSVLPRRFRSFIMTAGRRVSVQKRIYFFLLTVLLPVTVLGLSSGFLYGRDTTLQAKQSFVRAASQISERLDFNMRMRMDSVKQLAFGSLLNDAAGTGGQSNAAMTADMLELLIHQNSYLFKNVTDISVYDTSWRVYASTNRPAAAVPSRVREMYADHRGFVYIDTEGRPTGRASIFFPLYPVMSVNWIFPYRYIVRLEITDFLEEPVPVRSEMVDAEKYLFNTRAWQLSYYQEGQPLNVVLEGMFQAGLLLPGAAKTLPVPANISGYETDRFFIAVHDIPQAWHRLAYSLPENAFSDGERQLWYYILFFLIICMLLVTTLAGPVTSGLTRPLASLQRFFDNASGETKALPVRPAAGNEVGMLAASFDGLLRRISLLQKDLRKREVDYTALEHRKTELELLALQAQIDPHFISNLFISMRFLLKGGQTEKLEKMINAAGQFLRNSVTKQGSFITLAQEVQLIKNYVDIQNIRFDGALVFIAEASAAALSCLLPKFLLQPAAENAVVHGMKRRAALTLRLRAQVNENRLVISVSDDGAGINKKQLAELKERLNGKCVSDGIGLLNICERIRVTYGSESGSSLTIDSREQAGTDVTITVPAGPPERKGRDEPDV